MLSLPKIYKALKSVCLQIEQTSQNWQHFFLKNSLFQLAPNAALGNVIVLASQTSQT